MNFYIRKSRIHHSNDIGIIQKKINPTNVHTKIFLILMVDKPNRTRRTMASELAIILPKLHNYKYNPRNLCPFQGCTYIYLVLA